MRLQQCVIVISFLWVFIVTSTLADKQCLSKGGVCRPADECLTEVEQPQKGLCNNASHKCCHGPSTKANKCSEFGGQCLKKCGNVETRATDCKAGTKCCPLV